MEARIKQNKQKKKERNLSVIIISENSMRKLFKINQDQVSCFETKQAKKDFAYFWQHGKSPQNRNYNCSPKVCSQIKAQAWCAPVHTYPQGSLGKVPRACMTMTSGCSTGSSMALRCFPPTVAPGLYPEGAKRSGWGMQSHGSLSCPRQNPSPVKKCWFVSLN